jgi:hypothetical protein
MTFAAGAEYGVGAAHGQHPIRIAPIDAATMM